MAYRKVDTPRGIIEMSAVGALERAIHAMVEAERQAEEVITVRLIPSGATTVTKHPKWLKVAKEWHNLAMTLAEGCEFDGDDE
jgi:hypothetical protein